MIAPLGENVAQSEDAAPWTFPQGVYGAGYVHGYGDGQQTMLTAIQNALLEMPSPRAIYEFIGSVRRDEESGVTAAAVGIFDGQLYVWLVLEEIDVTRTRKLFDLKSAIEQSEQAQFELHVAVRQGRPIEDAIPKSFQLVDF